MCVGGHDSHIFIYNVPSQFKKFIKIKGGRSLITHIDYSENSKYIQCNNDLYEIHYFDIETGKHITKGETFLQKEKWATWTCTLGWVTQGIWPMSSNDYIVNTLDCDPSRSVIAIGDNYGQIKLFK